MLSLVLAVALLRSAAAVPPSLTLHPPKLASACTGGCAIASAAAFAPGVLAMPLHSFEHAPAAGMQALALSTNGGATFGGASAGTAPAHSSLWGAVDSPELLAAAPNVRYDNGLLVRQPDNASWVSAFRMRYEWDEAAGALNVTRESTPVVFAGLPRPATGKSAAKLPKILPTGYVPANWIRFGGSSIAHLGNSTWLRTGIVCWGDNPTSPAATSIVAYISRDGGARWDYVGTVADAKTYGNVSMEGPNEHDVVRLPSGRLAIAMRFDGGDGHDSCLSNCTAEWKPYFWATSDDDGRTWSNAVPMVGTGSARPRLLLVGSTLLLSGGRMRYKTSDGVGPSTDNNLWAADATSVATGSTPPVWRTYALSYWHNHLYDGSEGLPGKYTSRVNTSATNRPETRSYGSLLPACDAADGSSCSEAVLLYDVAVTDFTNGSSTAINSVAVAGSTAGVAPHCGNTTAYSLDARRGRYCAYAFAMRIGIKTTD